MTAEQALIFSPSELALPDACCMSVGCQLDAWHVGFKTSNIVNQNQRDTTDRTYQADEPDD